MYRSHPEVAVLIDEGNGRGGDKAERERNHEAHDEDHDAVEPAQLVPPEGGEGHQGGRAVDDRTGEDAPDEHAQPGTDIILSIILLSTVYVPHLIEVLDPHGGVQTQHGADGELVLETRHLGHLVMLEGEM